VSKVNYRHLYYFWVVAKEGGFARAAEHLNIAIQTISAQVKALEQDLGHALLKPAGRKVALTEAGQAVFVRAEAIFQLGESIPEAVSQATATPIMRLAVGMSDGLSKLASHALLNPILSTPSLKLTCHEGEVEQLMRELALHKLDLVLACQPPSHDTDQRLTSDRLMICPVDWYGPAQLLRPLAGQPLMDCLARLPLLLPTLHAGLRSRIDRWFEAHQIVPHVVGEFEDSALLTTFGSSGMGVFPASERMRDMLSHGYNLNWFAPCEGVEEHFYAIGTARKVQHPLVQKLMALAPAS